MLRRSQPAWWTVVFVLALVLAACGGGDPATDETPGGQTEADGGETETAGAEGAPHEVEFDWGTFTLNDQVASKLESGDPLNFVLSIEGTGIPVFGAAMAAGWDRGIEGYSDQHPIEGRVVGPVDTDIAAQVAEIDSLLASGSVDCLAFEAHEPGPYIDVIDQAMEDGIPVFGVNADSPDSKRIAFYALDELSAGTTAGEITADIISEEGLDVQTAALMTGSVEGPWAQNRMKGFMEGLQGKLPDVEFINGPNEDIESQGFDAPQVYSAVEAYINGHPDVDLIFHTDQGVEQVGKAIQDLGLTGEMWAAGFNVSEGIVEYIKSGEILVSVGQGFSNQAEAGAKACAEFLLNGEYETGHVVLDPVPVTAENADEKDWFDPANQ